VTVAANDPLVADLQRIEASMLRFAPAWRSFLAAAKLDVPHVSDVEARIIRRQQKAMLRGACADLTLIHDALGELLGERRVER
jgi:hypothetical protein